MKFQFKLRTLLLVVAYYAVLSVLGTRAVIYGTAILVWVLLLRSMWRSATTARQWRRAWLDLHCGDYEQAIAEFTSFVESAPRNPDTYMGRGSAYFHMGNYEFAIKDWAEVVRLRPNYGEARANLGAAWLQNGGFDQAAEHLAEAVRLDRRLAYGQYNLGCAQLFRHEFAAAVDSFRDYSLSDRQSFEENFVASTHDDAMDPRWTAWVKAAIQAASRAIALNPHDAASHLARAIGHIHFGENAPAVDDCTAALAVEPDDALALYVRSYAQAEMGREAEAAADLQRARELACREVENAVE